MEIHLVHPHLVEQEWKHVAPHLDKAIKKSGGHTTPALLWQECVLGQRNLLLFTEGGQVKIAAIVTLETWGGKSVAHLNLACGGSVKLWVANLPLLSTWAKQHGAEKIILGGQANVYDRILTGAKRLFTTYELEI